MLISSNSPFISQRAREHFSRTRKKGIFVSSNDWSTTQFETRAIHAGQDADPATGAVITPIYQTSTYVQEEVGVHKGFEYARTDNPTRSALQEAIASLEGGSWGLSYASGLAATQNLLYLLRPGDHILLSDDAYGGTYRLVAKIIANYGIEFSLCNMSDPEAVRAGIRPNTRIVWAETPTNPYLKIVDIAAVAEIAHGAGARLVVDNTFASPYLQRPLELGADFVSAQRNQVSRRSFGCRQRTARGQRS